MYSGELCCRGLSNLQFALEFPCPFVIRKGAPRSHQVDNLILVFIVTNVASDQFGHPYHAFHIRSALNQPFDFPRSKVGGLLRVDTERRFSPHPKGWVWRRRSIKKSHLLFILSV